MAQKLIIVESPAKAGTIGKFVGKGYKIIASAGHVRDLPKSVLGVEIEKEFEPKYITIRGKGDVLTKLRKEAKNSEKIFLATDPDREGEAISWHLAELLGIDINQDCRITFNEITKNAVNNAIKAPRKINMNLVDAQQARRILDRIVGYKLSPLLWKKVKKGLSAGRVQSVATRIVVDRELEIEAFVPKEYWTIIASLSKKNEKAVFHARYHGKGEEKTELVNKEQVDKILKEIENVNFIVSKIKKGDKKKLPPPPFITSTLQQEAAKRYGFPTKKTMSVAQQLYEGIEIKGKGATGLVTYIRTDSVRISGEALEEAKAYIKSNFGEKYLAGQDRIYKNKSASQDAHEAIRPTHTETTPESIKDSLTNDQFKLYRLIWERFLASRMAGAEYDTVNVDINAGKHLFKAGGQKLKFKGYLAVYNEAADEETAKNEIDADNNKSLPEMSEKEVLVQTGINPKQHYTQPPSRYTEASLVKALEEKGIGRPSTYAPTITTIISRGYVLKDKKFLMPTELGKIVTDIMKAHFSDIVDIQFTAQMEEKFDSIEEGQKKWVDIMKEFYGGFIDELSLAEANLGHVEVPPEESDIECENCGRKMVFKMGRFGKFLACPGFPECRNTKAIIADAGVPCPKCGKKLLIKKTKKGRTFYSCENKESCGYMSWEKPKST